MIAGKGHETVPTVGDAMRPFDDRELVRTAPATRAPGAREGAP